MAKIITLWEPYASLVAYNLKRYETRSWPTGYRGELYIHAAQRKVDLKQLEERGVVPPLDFSLQPTNRLQTSSEHWQILRVLRPMLLNDSFPYGKIVAKTQLTSCNVISEEDTNIISKAEHRVGIWTPGQYKWKLKDTIRLVEPVAYKGGQGLRDFDPCILKQLSA